MNSNWDELSPEEKQEERLNAWLSASGKKFSSPEAEDNYRKSITRIKDAIQLKKVPDRVPVVPHMGFFPAYYMGISPKDMMYDYVKLTEAWRKYVLDFKPDAHQGAFETGPGRLFDILDYKLYAWPGHGVSPNSSYQCLEREYMTATEYDALIQDPSDFFKTIYLPRIFGALGAFSKLPPLTDILELPNTGTNFIPYGLPEVQSAYKALLEAGIEARKWGEITGAFELEMAAAGYPNFFGSGSKAPFDVIGDTLRGTVGIMLDLFRQPKKLLEALEVITPLMIKMGVSSVRWGESPIVFMPLHKGADGFLSDKQFRNFYWPSLRKVLLGLIDEGCVPFTYAEGNYNTRLEVIKDFPKGKVIWSFDQTDMLRAKEALGGVACIAGNMPSSTLKLATKQEVKDSVKLLIDSAAKDGGYMMINGAVIEEAKVENVKTWIDYTKEYGTYA